MSQIGVTILASGSNGNCTIVHCGDQAIMIDCGISLRTLRARIHETGIQESWIKALLITHEHTDHISGAKVVAAHLGVPIYATPKCVEKLQAKFHFGPMTMIALCADFMLAGFTIRAFPISHDAVEPVGYVLARESAKIGVATDLGQTNQMTHFQLRDCSTLVLESNYDLNMLAASSRPWILKNRILGPIGHLSNADSAKFLPSIVTRNTRNVILAHVSGDCNTYELAMKSAQNALAELARTDICLAHGSREGALGTVWC